MVKTAQNKDSDHQGGLRDAVRALDLGNGIEVTMGLRQENGSIETLYHFKSSPKKVKKSSQSTLGDLSIEYSSTKTEDDDLLNYLAKKTR